MLYLSNALSILLIASFINGAPITEKEIQENNDQISNLSANNLKNIPILDLSNFRYDPEASKAFAASMKPRARRNKKKPINEDKDKTIALIKTTTTERAITTAVFPNLENLLEKTPQPQKFVENIDETNQEEIKSNNMKSSRADKESKDITENVGIRIGNDSQFTEDTDSIQTLGTPSKVTNLNINKSEKQKCILKDPTEDADQGLYIEDITNSTEIIDSYEYQEE